jgi:aspartate carbamoyltransferase catalytic subunit
MSKIIPKHLLGIEGLTREQVDYFLDTAEQFVEVGERSVKKVPTLRGKTVINLFLEASTRTRSSFEIAGKRMSADVINISGSSSSTTKGETLLDTAYNLQSMSPDILVVRHAASGSAAFLAKHLKNTAVINAGDGLHEHPTQALLDALTIKQKLGTIDNLKITIVGDVLRSRVARSDIHLFKLYGCKINVVAPPTIALPEFKAMGVNVFHNLEAAVDAADVVYSLRMKHEYQKDHYVPHLDEYSKQFIVSERVLSKCAPKSIVLAPGPIIRGVEITSEVADGPRSLIQKQVNNGVAVRMAALFLLSLGKGEQSAEEVSELENKKGTKLYANV